MKRLKQLNNRLQQKLEVSEESRKRRKELTKQLEERKSKLEEENISFRDQIERSSLRASKEVQDVEKLRKYGAEMKMKAKALSEENSLLREELKRLQTEFLPSLQVETNGVTTQKEYTVREARAAAKIQAAFRGHQTRRQFKKAKEKRQTAMKLEKRKEKGRMKEDMRLRAEQEEAATKIQSRYRGYQTRKNLKVK